MKTQSKLNFHHSYVKLPEIIVWIIGILTFICLFFGFNLNAQTTNDYRQDTIWLKSGEVIPCKISVEVTNEIYLSFSYKSGDGKLVFDQISKNKIQRYKKDVSAEDTFIILCRIELKDGAIFSGNIISETETHINFYTADIGLINIKRERVKRIRPINATKEIRKSFWFDNPHSTRLLFAPTAIPLKRGEGYYQNIYVYINMFNYGIINNLSIGAGFDIITMFIRRDGEWNPMLNFNIKSGFKVSKNLHLSAGGLYITMPGQFSAGILYGVGTAGNYNNNFTFGMGSGFVDGQFEEKPFIMFGGMARISERLWFVSENWVAPINNSEYYFLLSYGLRISSRRVAVDIAFVNSEDIFEVLVIGVPYVDVVIKLGKKH